MKQPIFFPLFAIAMFVSFSTVSAQPLFGIEQFCLPENTVAKVSLPAAALTEMVKANQEGITLKDACLETPPTGQAQGYQADFDGDGKEEMWLLYHSGPADAGCNALFVVTPAGGGKYTMHEMVAMSGGKALIRPIVTLEKGTQMYFQSVGKGADGKVESRGAILAYTQTAVVPLTTWIEKNPTVDGKVLTQDIKVALFDVTFDNRKEILLQYSLYKQAGGKLSDKNLADRYVLTLDFVPANYNYSIYDSASYTKMQEADALAKTGQRMLARASTAPDGIVKIREALRINPFLTKTRVFLGRYFLNSGRYADAEKALVDASQIEPSYAQTYLILGDTYLRLSDMQKTLSAYTTFLKLNPDSKDKKKVEHNIKQITIPKGHRH